MKDDLDEFKYRHVVRYYPDEFDFYKTSSEKASKFSNKCKIVLASFNELCKQLRASSEKILSVCNRIDMEEADTTLLQSIYAIEEVMLKNLDSL